MKTPPPQAGPETGPTTARIDPADDSQLAAIISLASTAVTDGRIEELCAHAQRAAALGAASDTRTLMRIAGILQAAFRFSGDAAMMDLALAFCVRVANRTNEPQLAIPARALAGNVYMLAGRLHEAIEHCDAAIALAAACELADHRVVAMSHQFRGYVLLEWNRVHEARGELVRAWELTGALDRGVRSGVARVMAELELMGGDTAAALHWSEALTGIVGEPMSLRNREWLAAVRARHGFAANRDLRELDLWQRRFDYRAASVAALPSSTIAARLQECEHLMTLLEATRQWDALGETAMALERGSRPLRLGYVARALTARAVSLEATGATTSAREVWRDALVIGDVGSFVRVYVDGSPLRMRLLQWATTDRIAGIHARRVLEAIKAPASTVAPGPLTPRQQEILRLVATGLSDRAIGQVTGVSVSTVKTHLRAVYTQLAVTSRTAAVARAIERGLF